MLLVLAPMEGLLDFTLRDIITRVGGVDYCVSEFIRVSGTLLPDKVFLRIVPELATGSRTRAGVPVRPQLMGSDPACLAENAQRLAALAPAGIDLNFGCPAKTVNRHRGGAALLEDPELLTRIVRSVRDAVPPHIPVSAKMRLGFNDDSKSLACAQAIAAGGASALVVHARTKAQGYRPPAYWDRIAEIREALAMPVIANGEIWTPQDATRARRDSGCDALMLGRGMTADPGLALAIRRQDQSGVAAPAEPGLAWAELQPLLWDFWELIQTHLTPIKRPGRMKQWLKLLRGRHPEAARAYLAIRALSDPGLIAPALLTA